MNSQCATEPTLFGNPQNNTFVADLRKIGKDYSRVHGYLCLIICFVGVSTNIVNVIVLTRKRMRSSSNVMLTGIAICDIGTMFSYSLYIGRFNLVKSQDYAANTYPWMVFIVIHMYSSVVLHSTGLWYAIAVSFIRYMIIRQASFHSAWHDIRRAMHISIYLAIAIGVATIPSVLTFQIEAIDIGNRTIYTVDVADIALANKCALFKSVLWLQATAFKVVPCILLSIMITCLVNALQAANKRRSKLLGDYGASAKYGHRRNKQDHTTIMLLCIVTLSLLTEIPQGVVLMLTAIYVDVGQLLYPSIADILDLLSLINSSVNFYLYCGMSGRYRKTVWEVALPGRVYQKLSSQFGVGTNEISETQWVNDTSTTLRGHRKLSYDDTSNGFQGKISSERVPLTQRGAATVTIEHISDANANATGGRMLPPRKSVCFTVGSDLEAVIQPSIIDKSI